MSFLHPYALLLLVLPLILAGLTILTHYTTAKTWHKLVSSNHVEELALRSPTWRTVLPAILALTALSCIIIALARPINGYEEGSALSSGRNLIIALDISRSMETQDVTPSRLEEARAAAYELIDALPSDKIGLIVFSGEADMVVPLTYDHTALRDALEQVNRNWAGTGGTNFGLVLRRAMQDFSRSAPDGTNALVILSDGEDTVDSSLEIAEEARNKKLLVITVGIGTEAGGAIPDPKGENGLWQDSDGKHIISKLNIKALRQFSEATGGDYFIMGSGSNLADFAQKAVNKIDRHEETFSASKSPRDLFGWFAGLALLLLTSAIVLNSEWKRPQHMSILVLILLTLGNQSVSAAPDKERVQSYAAALSAKVEGSDNEQIRTLLSQALLDEDPTLQAAAFLALGNLDTNITFEKLRALYQREPVADDPLNHPMSNTPTIEQLEGIIQDLKKNTIPWQDALKADSSLSAAKQNITKVEKLIQKLEEEIERLKQQQNQDNQDQQGEQNQQQDKQDQQGEQNQQQDNQDQQGEQNQQQDKQDQQGEQNQQQDKQDQQGEQNQQQDNQDQQGEQNQQQDKQDQQGEQNQQQDKQNQQQDKQNQQQDKQNQRQDKQNQQGGQNQQQDQQDQQDEQNQQQSNQENQKTENHEKNQHSPHSGLQQSKLTDQEKARQRSASILQMHLDEEKGSPIPHFNDNSRPPKKDY